MNKTVLAMTTALILAGAAATSASAYDRYDYYGNNNGTRYSYDRDCDGVPDRRDHYIRDRHDADCDGVPDRYDRRYNRHYSTRGDWQTYGNHRWSIGGYLPREYYGSTYYFDYEPYGLEAPRYGYRWNRVGNDAYLISTRNGLIIRVEYNVFR